MTEYSQPWDGVTDGDAAVLAPYAENEWDENERLEMGSGGNVGVLPNAYGLNQLEVTERGAGANMSVDVDTGAALVYGKRYWSDATVNLVIGANASGFTRYDRVVAVWNRQAIAYTGVTPNIAAKTCRVAVLEGTPGAGSPALTQTAGTVYMIPLALVEVANGAVSITDSVITDEREMAGVGNMQRIDQHLGAATGAITFSSIPARFQHLMLVFQGRVQGAVPGAITADWVRMTYNNDAGANYDYEYLNADQGGAVTSGGGIAAAYMYAGQVTADGGVASAGDGMVIHIPNYRRTTLHKVMISSNQIKGDGLAANLALNDCRGWWRSTAAINRIDLAPNAGVSFMAGTVIHLYGVH